MIKIYYPDFFYFRKQKKKSEKCTRIENKNNKVIKNYWKKVIRESYEKKVLYDTNLIIYMYKKSPSEYLTMNDNKKSNAVNNNLLYI